MRHKVLEGHCNLNSDGVARTEYWHSIFIVPWNIPTPFISAMTSSLLFIALLSTYIVAACCASPLYSKGCFEGKVYLNLFVHGVARVSKVALNPEPPCNSFSTTPCSLTGSSTQWSFHHQCLFWGIPIFMQH
jgi:hypothetical protein